MKKLLFTILCIGGLSYGAEPANTGKFDTPAMGNPIVPGYFADPTVRKVGDTYYMYATTDGTAAGNGPAQVWVSKDFVNWTNLRMNWPASKWIWAPEVVQAEDEKFYFYYSQPCQIHAGVSESPIGPWKSLNPNSDPNMDGMIVPNQYVPPVITLDWQTFLDDDGKRYGMFCTWAIYPNNGCGMVEVDKDMLPIDANKWMIPNTELIDIFEAPFMIKKDGVYYLTYSSGSCHDDTYRVQYATATDIKGPYTYDTVNNPILSSNADGTVHGPGHHGLLQEGDDTYIIYHRHDNPHSNHGMHRQIAADKLEFGLNNTIKPVVPTHTGIGYLGKNTNPFANLVFNRNVKASSYYDERFKPGFAVDDNNGTLWKARDNTFPQTLEIDLGQLQPVKRTWTQFQYPTWYYQYMIEYSSDGKSWAMFSDKRDNRQPGCPMVDFGDVEARYLRLTITGLERPGMYAGVWNFKAFEEAGEDPPQQWVHLEAEDLPEGPLGKWQNNKGMLGGDYVSTGDAMVKILDGRKAVVASKGASLELNKAVPETLQRNKTFTFAGWVYAPNKGWQHVAVISDGKTRTTYLNGKRKDSPGELEQFILNPFALQIQDGGSIAAISSLRVYARALHPAEIENLMGTPYKKPAEPSPRPKGLLVDLDASDLNMGSVTRWTNKGVSGESFVPDNSTPMTEIVAGIKAVTFKGSDALKSTFSAPTLWGNGNYTVAVWAYNPAIDDTEFMVSWAKSGGLDSTSSLLGYGKHDAWGAIGHQGWSDMGYRTLPSAGTWHHIAVTFDGSMEKLYVDGRLDNEEGKMLYAEATPEIWLGRAHDDPRFFAGSLASVKMYDQALSPEKIAELAGQKPTSEVMVNLDAGGLDYGLLDALDNTGSLEGQFKSNGEAPLVRDVFGRIAMAFKGQQQLALDTIIPQDTGYSISAYVNAAEAGAIFAFWEFNGRRIPAAWLPKAAKPRAWHHVVITGEALFVDGEKVSLPAARMPAKELKQGLSLLVGKGFKGAIAKLTVFNRALSGNEVRDLYAAVNADLIAPGPCLFERTPDAITPEAVGMAAARATDESGWVQYYFEEVSGNPGGRSSGWISENRYENWGLQANKDYAYTLRMRDYYGNVSAPTPVAKARTASSLFTAYTDDFSTSRNYLANRTSGSIWDGLITKGTENMTVGTARAEGGKLRLEATAANIDTAADGPFLYKTVKGDFVVEAKVADMQGWTERKPPGLLEPLLMIRVADDAEAGEGRDQVRSGIFPYWNCGNLWTSLDGPGRPQGFNGSGYNADLYLQIQRSGERIHLRTSPDGKTWKPLPNTPIHRADMAGVPLQVGLALSIGDGGETGWVEFDWIRILVKK